MMKLLISIFAVLILVPGITLGKEKKIKFSELPDHLQFTITRFEKAIPARDTALVMGLLDRDYKAHEHDEYFQKKTGFFLNEFFCGVVVGTDQTHCIPFNTITLVKRTGINKVKKSYQVNYLLKTPEREISTQITFAGKKRIVYGAVGSRGFTQLGGL